LPYVTSESYLLQQLLLVLLLLLLLLLQVCHESLVLETFVDVFRQEMENVKYGLACVMENLDVEESWTRGDEEVYVTLESDDVQEESGEGGENDEEEKNGVEETVNV